VARRFPKLLDNEESFDEVLGPGRFAMTDREVLDLARGAVNGSAYSEVERRASLAELIEDVRKSGKSI
jgi:hypothetical protein